MAIFVRFTGLAFVAIALMSYGQGQVGSRTSTLVAVDPLTTQQAEGGDREAQNKLGLIAQENHDYAEAIKWFKRAADQGLSKSQVSLGFFYGLGLGVKQDLAESARWYGLAAAQGDADGEFGLGICYLHGEGVRQDWDLAIRWFATALNHGEDEGRSANGIGLAYEKRPHHDKSKDYAEAYRWYSKGAEMGYGESQFNVCRLTAQGFAGVTADYHEAITRCSQLAGSDDEGSALGQYGMGQLYEHGLGVQQDSKVALQWYLKSAEQGNTSSQMKVATFYSLGKGVEGDLVQAYKWAKIANILNHPSAAGFLEDVSSHMSKPQILAAEELIDKWTKEHPIDPEGEDHVDIDGRTRSVHRPK